LNGSSGQRTGRNFDPTVMNPDAVRPQPLVGHTVQWPASEQIEASAMLAAADRLVTYLTTLERL
jgi:hypothetical protein